MDDAGHHWRTRTKDALTRVLRGWRDVVCALAVVAMVAHSHYNARATRDVGPDDEAWYVAAGVLHGKPSFPNGPDGWPIPELGALHCLSYFGLSKLFSDPLELYYEAWRIRITLIALGVFVLVRRARQPWWQALGASFAFVTCSIADVWPFPVHTAALIVLAGLVAASFARTTTTLLGVVCVSFAFAGFCRPELLYAYAAAVLAFALYLAREVVRAPSRLRALGKAAGWLAAVIAPGALLRRLLGDPLDGTRAFYAFAQHYTLNLFEAQGSDQNPWASWMPTVARDFPGASTVVEALRANPGAFFEHVGRNVKLLPHNTLLATRPVLEAARFVELTLLAAAVVFSLVQVRWMLRHRRPEPARSATLFALACAFVPFSLSMLVVHPRLHYYVVVVVLAIALVASCPLPRVSVPRPRWATSPSASVASVLAICAIAVCATGTKDGAATLAEWLTRRPTKTQLFGHRQRTITRLRDLRLKGPLVALEYEWGTCFYAGYDCVPLERWDKVLPFDELLVQRKIDVVLLRDEMLRDPRFADDPQVADFLAHPEQRGFVLERVPGADVYLGIRADRLPAPTR